jgi:hypothetical protein
MKPDKTISACRINRRFCVVQPVKKIHKRAISTSDIPGTENSGGGWFDESHPDKKYYYQCLIR